MKNEHEGKASSAAPGDGAGAVAWQEQLADALEVFWNASLSVTHNSQDATANAVMGGMVEGFAAMANRLRQHTAAPAPAGVVTEAMVERFIAEYHGMVWDKYDDTDKAAIREVTRDALNAALGA